MKDIAVCSVPLLEDGQPIGVMTLERGRGEVFDDATIELCEAAGALLGPVLALKQENSRGTLIRLRESLLQKAQLIVGPRHPGAKLAALCVVGLVAFLSLATGTYRVAAKLPIHRFSTLRVRYRRPMPTRLDRVPALDRPDLLAAPVAAALAALPAETAALATVAEIDPTSPTPPGSARSTASNSPTRPTAWSSPASAATPSATPHAWSSRRRAPT